jgi:hypothetical protein
MRALPEELLLQVLLELDIPLIILILPCFELLASHPNMGLFLTMGTEDFLAVGAVIGSLVEETLLLCLYLIVLALLAVDESVSVWVDHLLESLLQHKSVIPFSY